MWNNSYTLPGFLILLIFLVHYFAMPRVRIKMNRTFLYLVAWQVLILPFEALSPFVEEAALPVWVLYLFHVSFYCLVLARSYWFFLFTRDSLLLKPEEQRALSRFAKVAVLLLLGLVLSTGVTGAVFRIADGRAQPGPLRPLIQVFSILCPLLSLRLARVFSRRLSRFRYWSAQICQYILLAGSVHCLLLPQYPVMNTFCLLALIVIYLSFENPDLYLANRGMSFNMRAFREVLKETVGKKGFRVLAFTILDYIDMRGIYGGLQMDRGVALIGEFLATEFPEYQVFYLRSGRFVLFGSEAMNWDRVRTKIHARFQEPWAADDAELDLNVAFVQLDSNSGLETDDRIINFLLTAFDKARQVEPLSDGLLDSDSLREIDHRADVKRSLERAIEQNGVEIFLQPLIDGNTRKPVGAEVLSRIRDDQGKIISPSLFVPIAEQSGRINLMGEQVLEKTCQFIRDHDLDDLGLSWVNVNLSPLQCMKKDLSERFLTIIGQYGISADLIRLEITEQSILDIPLMEKQIATLRGSGFRFALDDYGSGYSNLTRVKRYPFVNIKLDMEVVWDYFYDQDDLLPTIVQAFKQMDYTITAEGIETEEMAESMHAIGCDYLQGFYFSKPLPAEEFVRLYSATA